MIDAVQQSTPEMFSFIYSAYASPSPGADPGLTVGGG